MYRDDTRRKTLKVMADNPRTKDTDTEHEWEEKYTQTLNFAKLSHNIITLSMKKLQEIKCAIQTVENVVIRDRHRLVFDNASAGHVESRHNIAFHELRTVCKQLMEINTIACNLNTKCDVFSETFRVSQTSLLQHAEIRADSEEDADASLDGTYEITDPPHFVEETDLSSTDDEGNAYCTSDADAVADSELEAMSNTCISSTCSTGTCSTGQDSDSDSEKNVFSSQDSDEHNVFCSQDSHEHNVFFSQESDEHM